MHCCDMVNRFSGPWAIGQESYLRVNCVDGFNSIKFQGYEAVADLTSGEIVSSIKLPDHMIPNVDTHVVLIIIENGAEKISHAKISNDGYITIYGNFVATESVGFCSQLVRYDSITPF